MSHFEMPKPNEHHAKLAALAGTWQGKETLFPSQWVPETRSAEARVTARMDVGGFFLITDYVEEREGKVNYRGHGVFGFCDQEGVYTMYWFDDVSPGSLVTPAKGRWEGDTLAFENESPMGKGRYVYTLTDGGYTFRIETSRDGKTWSPMVEGRYTRA
jgi:hypothetical protein